MKLYSILWRIGIVIVTLLLYFFSTNAQMHKDTTIIWNSLPCYDSVGNVTIYRQIFDHIPTHADTIKYNHIINIYDSSNNFISNAINDSSSLPKHNDSPKNVHFGIASYYSNKFVGKKTANGEIFSQQKLTAACNILPLGTWIKVTSIRNNESVVVKINDRMNKNNKRLVDLTLLAAKKLNYVHSGIIKVKIEVVNKR
jgi:rare lipoprotein A